MKIVKTRQPNQLPGSIVTRPSGEQVWWLVAVEDSIVDDLTLHNDVVEDTAPFFAEREIGRQWEEGIDVAGGEVLFHEDAYYRVIEGKGHTTQTDWAPPEASLFVDTDPFNIDQWKAPTGAQDAPNRRDLRQHGGEIYRSVIDGNTTEPGSDPRYWVQEGQKLPEVEAQVPNWSDFESHEFQSLDIGTAVIDNNTTYYLVDPGQGHRQPSGEFGHFGWSEEAPQV